MKNLITCILICISALFLPFLNTNTNENNEQTCEVDINKTNENNKKITIKESIYKYFSKDKSLRVVNINDDGSEIYIEIIADTLETDTEKSFNIVNAIETSYPNTFNLYTFAYTNKSGGYLFKSDYTKDSLSKLNWNSCKIDDFKKSGTNIFIDPSYR